ncbi:MAG: hypothetical protein GY861_01190 [bacterium]|nr:hypothetical protein [bacterium]
MKSFRDDNTEGYLPQERDELNTEWEKIVTDLKLEEHTEEYHIQEGIFAERVSRRAYTAKKYAIESENGQWWTGTQWGVEQAREIYDDIGDMPDYLPWDNDTEIELIDGKYCTDEAWCEGVASVEII